MKQTLRTMWNEDDGVLSFEWVLLVTLLTIGIVSGIAGARDAIIDELGDVANAAIELDQSYIVTPIVIPDPDGVDPDITAPGFLFVDTPASFDTCDRTTEPLGQGGLDDVDS